MGFLFWLRISSLWLSDWLWVTIETNSLIWFLFLIVFTSNTWLDSISENMTLFSSLDRKLYYLMKVCIYQLFMAPCFLYFVMGVASKTGVYVAGQVCHLFIYQFLYWIQLFFNLFITYNTNRVRISIYNTQNYYIFTTTSSICVGFHIMPLYRKCDEFLQ